MSSHPWELAWRQGRWYEASGPFPAVVEFAKHLKTVGAETVLDFGSGAGRHSIYLAKQGFRVVAFDLSRSALRLLNYRVRKQNPGEVLLVENEMSSLPFIKESFDAIVGNNVLHHATSDEIARTIDEVYRVLKPGAIGYFSVLSRNDYKYGAGISVEAATYVSAEKDELGIVHHFFSDEELRACFDRFETLSLKEELIPIEKGSRGHLHLRVRKRPEA